MRIEWNGAPEEWDSTDFVGKLQAPLLELIASAGISNQITHLALAPAIPGRVIFNQTNINSTTSALFYGLQALYSAAPSASNALAFSETPLDASALIAPAARGFLATMLRATTLSNTLNLIIQGVRSDGSFPLVPVLLAKTTDGSRNLRHLQFDQAIFESRIIDYPELTRTNTDAVPAQQLLSGLQTGLAQFNVAAGIFAPGAIADSMTSFGGVISPANDQTNLLAFIDAGATASYGTVAEPLADVKKFPDPMVYFYQRRGFSIAESYYLGLQQPYLGLIVAEPLAAPFARPGTGKWAMGLSNVVLSGEAQLTANFHARDPSRPLQTIELFMDGKYSTTLTNITPTPGDTLSLHLNGYPLSYTVPSNATLPVIISNLAAQLNAPSVSNATQIRAIPRGDRLELQTYADDTQSYPYYVILPTLGDGNNLATRITPLPENTPAEITDFRQQHDGRFAMRLRLPTQRHQQLEASTNLHHWHPIYTVTTPGRSEFVDPDSLNYPRRFYRLAAPPADAVPTIAFAQNPDRSLTLTWGSVPGQPAALLTSPDTLSWNSIATNLAGGTLALTYPQPTNSALQFFRAMHLASPAPQVSQIEISPTNPALKISGATQPYRVEIRTNSESWQTYATNFDFNTLEATATVPHADGNPTLQARMAQPQFLPSLAHGMDNYQLMNFPNLNPGAWLRFTITKTNQQVVVIALTNQTPAITPATFAAQMVALINQHPDLQGPDGLTADDFLVNSVQATFTLRARSPGFAAAKIRAHAQRSGLNLTPSTNRPLQANRAQLQSRNHLYLTIGTAEIPLTFTLDTTQWSDGYHELTAVAYEGNHVRTQTHAILPICISNSPLAATLDLGSLTNNASASGMYAVHVTANTNTVTRITLHSTGGPIGTATNQASATFSVIASNLWIGRHPFFATVETASGQKYRTATHWIRLQ